MAFSGAGGKYEKNKNTKKTEAVSEPPPLQPMRHAMDLQIKMEVLSAG